MILCKYLASPTVSQGLVEKFFVGALWLESEDYLSFNNGPMLNHNNASLTKVLLLSVFRHIEHNVILSELNPNIEDISGRELNGNISFGRKGHTSSKAEPVR